MQKLNKRIIVTLFVLLTIFIFQIQSVFAVTDLTTLSFTAYHLGGSEDDMNYGSSSEWGRRSAVLYGGKNVVSTDHTTVRFSVYEECQPFYCIEIGGHLDAVNGTEYSKSDYSYLDNIDNPYLSTDDMRTMIGSVLLYGFHDEFNYTDGNLWNVTYDNNKDNIIRYIATQTLIWETVYGYRDSSFGYISHEGYDAPIDFIENIPEKEAVQNSYNGIVNDVRASLKIPSFTYLSRDDALNNPYEVPFDHDQGFFSMTMTDKNNRLNDCEFYVKGGTLYFNTYGTSDIISVSIPKDTKATVNDPLILAIDPQKSYKTIIDFNIWHADLKQNGVTFKGYIKLPVNGYAAFYPGQYTPPEKGSIRINKRGEAFSGVEQKTVGDHILTIPVFSEKDIGGIEFKLLAAEDIYYDYELVYRSGTLIDTKVTDKYGFAEFSDLPAGKYDLVESVCKDNDYIEDTTPVEIILGYDKDKNIIDNEYKKIINEYQKVKVGGKKSFSSVNPNIDIDLELEMSKVLIGIYSGEDIVGSDNVILPKDTLISLASPDEEGTYEFDIELPGGIYYVKELEGSEYFFTDPEVHIVEANCDENLDITEKKADDIKNLTGKIKGIKQNPEGKPLESAAIGLFSDFECSNLIEIYETKADGIFEFNDLIIEKYYIKEIQAPDGYQINDQVFEVYPSIDIATDEYIKITDELIPTPTPSPTPSPTATPTPEQTMTPTPTKEIITTPTERPPERYDSPKITTVTHDNPEPEEPRITTTGEKRSFTSILGSSVLISILITAGIHLSYNKLIYLIMMKKR